MKSSLIIASVFALVVINVHGQEGGQLLMGTLVRQGVNKDTVVGNVEGVEEVKVKKLEYSCITLFVNFS